MSLERIIRAERVQGQPGMIAFGDPMILTYVNKAPKTAQVTSLTVSGATDAKKYTVLIDDVEISYKSGTGATTSTIATGLAAAINAEGLVNPRVLATAASNVVTLTANFAGTGFTYSEDDAQLAFAAVTANADSAAVPFGRGVLAAGSDGKNKLAQLASNSLSVAQVTTLTLTYDATVGARVSLKYFNPATGVIESSEFEHVMATDAATSLTALAAQINAVMPADTILAAAASDVLTLTSEVAGNPFEVSAGFGTGRDTGVWAVATTVANVSAADLVCGITVRSMTQDAGSDPEYAGGSAMSVAPDGYLFVHHEGTMTDLHLKKVYMRITANGTLDKLGAFASAYGAGLVEMKGMKWIGPTNTSNVAILKVDI